MPQYPIATTNVPNPSLKSVGPLSADTLVRLGRGVITNVVVTAAGDAPGGLYDSATIAGVGAGNKIADVPNQSGPVALSGYPFVNGLVYRAAADQIVNISTTSRI